MGGGVVILVQHSWRAARVCTYIRMANIPVPRVPLQHRRMRAIKTSRSDGQFSRFTIRR